VISDIESRKQPNDMRITAITSVGTFNNLASRDKNFSEHEIAASSPMLSAEPAAATTASMKIGGGGKWMI
jgi:hypothetical protein